MVIDEIQRVPELLPLVHRHIEFDKSLRFVLTGSSARKLRREGVDLLAGRAVLCSMHPFMAAELGDRFDLEAALRLGMVPLVVMADEPDRTLRGYLDLSVPATGGKGGGPLHAGGPLPAPACPGPGTALLTAVRSGMIASTSPTGLRGGQASATSKAVRLRKARLNSTPIRWIGSPPARYLSA